MPDDPALRIAEPVQFCAAPAPDTIYVAPATKYQYKCAAPATAKLLKK
jgi:hypothetical protein